MNKTKSKPKSIIVYTDGSCSGNGKKGAIGGIGVHFPNEELRDISKVFRQEHCTNQRTELYAILTTLRYIRENFELKKYKVIIKTDSQYSINCITKWVDKWEKNGWKTNGGTDVVNREFIEVINKYYRKYDISFVHIPAHTNGKDKDSVGNRTADELAVNATNRAKKEMLGGSVKLKKHTNSKTNTKKYNQGPKLKAKYQPRKRGAANIIVELVGSK
jgi:ribonuclease HI